MATNKLQAVTFLYEDEIEERQHSNAIEMLARDMGISVEDVRRVYEIVLKRFKIKAKVKDFLPILVSRRVKYLINKRRDGGDRRLKSSDSA